eukprot:TRINITY_DN3302_c0_g1_i1.p1 TRINITY_DN3302_c0_g1~~TRINITY_DN3302_c0_g1_i1.p1  ORF type:complete len:139 (+),score=9.13 TRINITY_DN3302_c0_g1_i1:1034-1450(+)
MAYAHPISNPESAWRQAGVTMRNISTRSSEPDVTATDILYRHTSLAYEVDGASRVCSNDIRQTRERMLSVPPLHVAEVRAVAFDLQPQANALRLALSLATGTFDADAAALNLRGPSYLHANERAMMPYQDEALPCTLR